MTISQVFFREFWSLFTFQFGREQSSGREGQLILVSVFPARPAPPAPVKKFFTIVNKT